MNKIYKVVRDNATGTYKAVSELGKSQGKGKGLSKKVLATSLAMAMGVTGANAANVINQAEKYTSLSP